MKPIQLTIKGLQSFQEKQLIDFEKLCEGGVFGIFGPTGSGKSTILDAMTLALYGSIDRSSGTKEIMNHAENQLAVTFTFELENANGKKQYMIERSYKRNNKNEIRQATSRLIEGEQVLADKTTDVNKGIEALLGLKCEDFMRAVVLPQGKFAQFLSLTGADRRAMLERLFQLEKYGKHLNEKLKSKLDIVRKELAEVEAGQRELGNASKEALDQATNDVQEANILLEKRKKELFDIQTSYEEKKQVRLWQYEKRTIEGQLHKAKQEEFRVKMQQGIIQRSEQAELLVPYFRQYEQIKTDTEKNTQKQQTLEEAFLKIKQEHEELEEQFNIARQTRQQQEPDLLDRKHLLQVTKETVTKLEIIEREVVQLQLEETKLATEKQELEKKLDHLIHMNEKAVLRQIELKEELVAKKMTSETKTLIRKSYELKQFVVNLEKIYEEQLMDATNKKRKFSIILEGKRISEEKNEEIKQEIFSIFEQIEELYNDICKKEKHFRWAYEQGTLALINLKQQLEKEQLHSLAQRLAKQLKQGERCPVCGSTEHIHVVSEIPTETEKQITELEKILKNSQPESTEWQLLIGKIKQYAEFICELVEKTLPIPKQQETNGNFLELLPVLSSELLVLQQQNTTIQTKATQIINKQKLLEKELTEITHHFRYEQTALEQSQQKKKELEGKWLASKNNWLEQFPYDFDEVEKLNEQLAQSERELEELQKKLDTSVEYMNNNKTDVESTKEQNQLLINKQTEVVTILQAKQEQVNELNQQAKIVLQNRSLHECMAETIHFLEILQKNEDNSFKQLTEKQKERQQVEIDRFTLIETVSNFTIRLQQTKIEWEKQLQDSSFINGEEVQQSLLDKQKQSEIRSYIKQYEEMVIRLQSEQERLLKNLQGRMITEGEWQEITNLSIEISAMFMEAERNIGAVLEKLKTISAQHIRFNELEIQRVEKATLAERYGKLQQVLRGNSFVEYMAEEQLVQVARIASEILGSLTRQRYAIEVDSQGGFLIRDDSNGGVRRAVSTLSGGETFLTSLSLALALSTQIQLRGEYPLQFFFLDEGFGTLDAELLDGVITSLEKLQSKQLSIGVISHVQELRERLPKRLIVEQAEPSGRGTVVRLERM